MDATPRPPRDGAIDLLKVLAIFAVIVIHVTPGGMTAPLGSFGWYSAVFWGSAARWAVPVFLMCSGALLIGPERPLPLGKLWGRNIVRIVAAMWAWGLAYKIYHLVRWSGLSALTGAALFQAVKEVLLFRQEFHFYYLHIILLVYAFLPVTRAFVAAADQRLRRYFLLLWFGLGIVYPLVKHFWPFTLLYGIPTQWLINMTYASIGYGVLGYELRQTTFRRAWPWALAFLGGLLGTIGGTVWRSLAAGKNDLLFWEGMTPFVALMAAGVFGFVSARVPRGKAPPRLIAHLSKASFCIFLAHVFFLWELSYRGVGVKMAPALLSIPLTAAAAFCCCEVVYLVLSRIPIVNRYLL